MFAQFNLSDASPAAIQATTSLRVSEEALAAAGRSQLEVPDDTDVFNNVIDLTQSPPVLIPKGD